MKALRRATKWLGFWVGAVAIALSGCVSQEVPGIIMPAPSPSSSASSVIQEEVPTYKVAHRTKRVLVLVDPVFTEPSKYWIDVQHYFCLIDEVNVCAEMKNKNRALIDQYVADLKAEGLTVFRMDIASTDQVYKNVEALRKLIQVQREFNQIEGVVLLGKFPYALIEDHMCKTEKKEGGVVECKEKTGPSYYYTDTVLGDLDGNWSKVFTNQKPSKIGARYRINNQSQSNHELGPDDRDLAEPEVWISRIDAERAMGGIGYTGNDDANPNLTMVRVNLKQDQVYRLRVKSKDVPQGKIDSMDARDFRAMEEKLPRIVAIHEAESGEPEKITPVYGSAIYYKPKKDGYFNLFLNISGARGSWIQSDSVEDKPVVLIETPSTTSGGEIDFSGPFDVKSMHPLVAMMNKSFLINPIGQFELYANYLQRNHLFRTKQWNPNATMIRLNTGEFFNEKQDGLENLAIDGVTQALKIETFNPGVFLSQLFPLGNVNAEGDPTSSPAITKTYKFGSLVAHSSLAGHEFENLFSDDSGWFVNMSSLLHLADAHAAAKILFFINHGCMDGNIDFEAGYPDTASVYLFRFGGLVQFGHSFLGPNGYYKEISETFAKGGDAGSGFLNSVRRESANIRKTTEEKKDPDYLGRKRAYYKILLGDGTLKIDY